MSFFERPADIDLGDNHHLWYFSWSPDRELNPQYKNVPDVDKAGAIIEHTARDGSDCRSDINFDVSIIKEIFKPQACWQVQSWEPLTLTPSILCKAVLADGKECGDHGFIREGRWVTV